MGRRSQATAQGLLKAVLNRATKVLEGLVLRAVREVDLAESQNRRAGLVHGEKLLKNKKKILFQKN